MKSFAGVQGAVLQKSPLAARGIEYKMQDNIKVLSNVFISAGGNLLRLVDVWFDQKITRILPCLDRTIGWEEISTPDKWKKFQKQISSSSLQEDSTDSSLYDGKFFLLIPGAIDTHVHFNTPGFEDREDFDHGSLAAVFGGVTTVVDMPCTSIPPVTSPWNLRVKLEAVNGRSWVDYAFWGGVSGNDFESKKDIRRQIRELVDSGVVGFKAYLISGMDTFTDLTSERMLQTAKWIRSISGKIPLAVHAEDKSLVTKRQSFLEQRGVNDWRAYCQARDVQAEAKAVETMLDIARKSKSRVHIVHLSSKAGLEMVRAAREKGLAFSAETCPHYLYFTGDDFANPGISAFLKTAPPVKAEADREALWQGLKDGTLSFVTTDHAGCDPHKEKSSNNFWKVYGGIPGVEHRVPFMFSEGFKKGKLTLSQTIDVVSANPAGFCRISHLKGSLEPAFDADMVLMNLWEQQEVRGVDMHSKGKYTPFEGVSFGAIVESTFLRGQLIIDRTSEEEPSSSLKSGQFLQAQI
jgi:allantoinase